MDPVRRKSGSGLMESFYKLIMRRNSVYVTFIIAGAFAGERAVDYGVKRIWENNNVGAANKFELAAKSWLDPCGVICSNFMQHLFEAQLRKECNVDGTSGVIKETV